MFLLQSNVVLSCRLIVARTPEDGWPASSQTLCQKLEACFNLSALAYLWNAVAPYSTFRLRSLCVNGCLPRSSCVNGCLPNTLLTCQDVPGSHSAFLCRVKGHTLTFCARRRGYIYSLAEPRLLGRGEGLGNCLYVTCSRCSYSCKPIRLQDLKYVTLCA